jgi:hypothetical protein
MNYVALGMPYVTKADRNTGVPWEFSLSESREWLKDRQIELDGQHAAKMAEQEEDAGITEARRKKIEVETQRLELRLSRERGELVPIDKVAELVESQMTTLRTHLLALPVKLTPILTGHTDPLYIKKTIDSYIREALEELAEDRVLEGVSPDMSGDVVHSPDKAHPLDAVLGIEDDVFGN